MQLTEPQKVQLTTEDHQSTLTRSNLIHSTHSKPIRTYSVIKRFIQIHGSSKLCINVLWCIEYKVWLFSLRELELNHPIVRVSLEILSWHLCTTCKMIWNNVVLFLIYVTSNNIVWLFKGSFGLNEIVMPFQNTCNLQQNSLLKCKIFIILITEKKSLKKKNYRKEKKMLF